MVSALAGVIAILALTAATGYFVAQEFAFVTADRAALSAEAEHGDRRARRALTVMGRLSFMLSGAQLGITVTALVVGFIAEPAMSALIAPALEHLGLSGGEADGVAVVAGFLLATVIQMVLGELLPKNLSLARAEPVAKTLAASTLAYLAVAGPVVRLFDATAARLVRLFGVEPVEELHHGATLEELGDIIGESRRAGRLPPDLSDLLQRALTFRERTAAEVMVPRPDVVAVPRTTTVAELTTSSPAPATPTIRSGEATSTTSSASSASASSPPSTTRTARTASTSRTPGTISTLRTARKTPTIRAAGTRTSGTASTIRPASATTGRWRR